MRSFLISSLAVLTVMAVSSDGASASASLNCSIFNKALTLELQGTISHGVGSGLISAEGTITLKLPIMTNEMKSVTFARDDITQYWLGPQDLKIRIYRESAGSPHQSIEVAIETRRKGDAAGIDVKGTYSGEASSMAEAVDGEAKTVPLKGQVHCQVE